MAYSDSTRQPPNWRAVNSLFVANAISMTGNQLALLAIPWFVLTTTGSASKTGVTAFFSLLPVTLATFFGGTFVDRAGFKKASIISDIASGITVLLIPILFTLDLLPFWMLQILVFLGALLDAPGATARDAMLPELAVETQEPLERIVSLDQVVRRSSRLLGAPLAGFLIALTNVQNVLYLNAATFCISALLVWIAVPTIHAKTNDANPPTRFISDLYEGLYFLRNDALLFTLTGIFLIINFFDTALFGVIYPVFVKEVYGSPAILGLLLGLSGGGNIIGTLIYGTIGDRYPRRKLYVWSFMIIAVTRIVLVFLPPLWILLSISIIVGLVAGPFNPIMITVSYLRIPTAMRGRVLGIMKSGVFMAMPFGVLLAGFALEWLGLRITLGIVIGCYLLVSIGLLFNRYLYEMDDE